MERTDNKTIRRGLGFATSEIPRVASARLTRHRTSSIERLLLIATIVVLPLQDHVPTIGGFSVMFLIFSVLAGYVLVTRPGTMINLSIHHVFLAGYAFLILGTLIEAIHPAPDFFELKRYGYMIAGSVAVASLCRDRQCLQAGLYGYLIMSVWLSVFLIMTFYGSLDLSTASSVRDADRIRLQVLGESPLQANLNKMAFQIAEGIVVALTFALTAASSRLRNLFLGVTVFCLVAAFMPMSRSGILITVISCAVVIFAFRGKRMRALVAVAALGIGILFWAPDVALTRLSSVTTQSFYEDKRDRAGLYKTILEHFPEYVATGVGSGNYWDWWARSAIGQKLGTHNAFLQVTVYWGLPALILFLIMLLLAYRCLPKRSGADPLSLCLLGISMCLLLRMFISHNLADKDFSIGLGMLVGASYWLWPKGITGLPSRGQEQPSKIRPQAQKSLG